MIFGPLWASRANPLHLHLHCISCNWVFEKISIYCTLATWLYPGALIHCTGTAHRATVRSNKKLGTAPEPLCARNYLELGAQKQCYLPHFSSYLATHRCTGTAYRPRGHSKTLVLTTPGPLCVCNSTYLVRRSHFALESTCYLLHGATLHVKTLIFIHGFSRTPAVYCAWAEHLLFEVAFETIIKNRIPVALHLDAHYSAQTRTMHDYARVYTGVDPYAPL